MLPEASTGDRKLKTQLTCIPRQPLCSGRRRSLPETRCRKQRADSGSSRGNKKRATMHELRPHRRTAERTFPDLAIRSCDIPRAGNNCACDSAVAHAELLPCPSACRALAADYDRILGVAPNASLAIMVSNSRRARAPPASTPRNTGFWLQNSPPSRLA